MHGYSKRVKITAMKKTGYSSKKNEITRNITENKRNIAAAKKSREQLKNNTAQFIVQAELYCKIYKDLEFIISGVNKTNVKLRIKRVIDDIINKLIPSSMRSNFSSLKSKLEELLKASKLDVSKIKNVIWVEAKNRIYNNVLDEAKKIYDNVYFNIDHLKIKGTFTTGEIAKWLRERNSIDRLKSFEKKLSVAGNVINKLDNVINMSEKAIKVFDLYSQGSGLGQQQSKLKTSKDYKEYYYKVAQEASKVASELKSFSSKLPAGMRDYYEFIFTVAENTDKMAKVVYDYTTRLESTMAELDNKIKKDNPFGAGGPTAWNGHTIINRKGGHANDDNVGEFFRQ